VELFGDIFERAQLLLVAKVYCEKPCGPNGKASVFTAWTFEFSLATQSSYHSPKYPVAKQKSESAIAALVETFKIVGYWLILKALGSAKRNHA
jgi:hypothetical protein